MELYQLDYFVAVAKSENVSKAAEMMNISQPALSANIQRLETELGVKLFDRRGRNIILNDYGRLFLSRVEPIIRDFSEAKTALYDLKRINDNELRLLSPPFSAFPGLAGKIQKACPHVRLNNINCNYRELRDYMTGGKLDFCFMATKLDLPGVRETLLADDEKLLIVSKESPLSTHDSIDLIELKDMEFADYPGKLASRSNLDTLCEQAGFRPNITFMGTVLVDVLFAVRNSGYVALAPARALNAYNLDGIKRIRISNPKCNTRLKLYVMENRRQRRIASEVEKVIIEYFKEHPSAVENEQL